MDWYYHPDFVEVCSQLLSIAITKYLRLGTLYKNKFITHSSGGSSAWSWHLICSGEGLMANGITMVRPVPMILWGKIGSKRLGSARLILYNNSFTSHTCGN
jgi:hypothetical protein